MKIVTKHYLFMSSDELRDLCKDEESYQKVRNMLETKIAERDRKARSLSLLESAISNDYDSILITEFDLEKPGPKIVYVNDGFCEMTGYSREEVIGQTPRILQGPKTDREVLDKLKRRLINGQCFFGQTVNYRKDGTEFVNQWDIHPLFDDEGRPTHWVSYQHDITKRKEAERRLVDTKIEFDQLREEAHCTTVDLDLEGNIVSANRSFMSLTGYDRDEVAGTKIWNLLSTESACKKLKKEFAAKQAEENFRGKTFKSVLRHKSGLPIQIKGITRVLDLKDGKVIRTEIKNISLQEKVKEALQERSLEPGE